jgi:hypothetical protein
VTDKLGKTDSDRDGEQLGPNTVIGLHLRFGTLADRQGFVLACKRRHTSANQVLVAYAREYAESAPEEPTLW